MKSFNSSTMDPNYLWLLRHGCSLTPLLFRASWSAPFCAPARPRNDPLPRPLLNVGEHRGAAASPASCVVLLAAQPRYKNMTSEMAFPREVRKDGLIKVRRSQIHGMASCCKMIDEIV